MTQNQNRKPKNFHKMAKIDAEKEVLCCLSPNLGTTCEEIQALTGMPEKMTLRLLKKLARKMLIHETDGRWLPDFFSSEPLLVQQLESYWEKTRPGIDSDVRWRICLGIRQERIEGNRDQAVYCQNGFWRRSCGEVLCPQCISQTERRDKYRTLDREWMIDRRKSLYEESSED